jgi:bifunctional non-homologous end joining protein LigD
MALSSASSSDPSVQPASFEVKFDGYRAQLQKAGANGIILGRNGGDFTRRFPAIAAAVLGLPTRSCVIDGKLIAAGRHGQPDFLALCTGDTRRRASIASISLN